MSQVLSLHKNELDLLASFLGHDIQVHREFYRLPQQTMQVAKLSKLLFATEKGDISTLVGKSLDDIDVDVNGKNRVFHHFMTTTITTTTVLWLFYGSLDFVLDYPGELVPE